MQEFVEIHWVKAAWSCQNNLTALIESNMAVCYVTQLPLFIRSCQTSEDQSQQRESGVKYTISPPCQ